MMRFLFLSVGLTLGAFASGARGTTPADLLPLVPDDYTFCLVAHRADTGLRSPADSTVAKAFWQSAVVKELSSHPDVVKLLTAKDQLVRQLGTTDADLMDLAFGGTLALIYRKPADSKPETEAGLLILHTERAKPLAEIVDRINQLQIRGGDLRAVEEVKHKSPYWKRAKADPAAAAEFYWLGDGLLIFTSNESLLRDTLDRRLTSPAKAVAATQFKNLGLADSPLALLVNPRSFDREVEAEAQAGKPGQRTVLDLFAQSWKAVDQIAVYARRSPDWTFGLAVGCDTARLPAAVRTLLAGFGRPLNSWDRLPEEALFAMVLPFQLAKADEFLKAVVPEGDHKKMRDAVLAAVQPLGETIEWETLLRAFGPEVAVWVSPPQEKTAVPALAVALPLDPADAVASAKLATDGLDFLVRFLSLTDAAYKVSAVKVGGVSVKKVAHPSFPPGVEPCYAVRDGAVILASHPRMIGEYRVPAADTKSRDLNPLIRMSGRAWGQYLDGNAEQVVEKLTADPKQQASTARLLKGLSPMLTELDRVEINVTAEKNRARLQLQFVGRRPRPSP